LIVEAGASHFAWSERVSEYTALFIRKAAQARIPVWPIDTKEFVKCKAFKPESGIVDGDGLFHLDEELARANAAFNSILTGREPQFVTFADVKSGKPIFVGHDLRLKLKPEWSGADTFKVAGTYLEKSPDKYPKVETARHAATPIQFRVFGGAAEQIAPNEFRVGINAIGKLRAEILAFNSGDQKFRWAEQQGRITLPEKLNAGKAQTISFAPIGNLKSNALPLKLSATSDAGLPVRFFVESGPAYVEGDTLHLADVPKRAAWPLKVVVVAWQYGSAIDPLVKSAEPVKHNVEIEK
jgi:hypothetical protein